MSESRKKTILYFYTAESPFVEKDIQILKENYRVKTFFFNVYQKKRLPLILFQQFCFILKNSFRYKGLICQFAGLHSFLPVLLSSILDKKSVIVAGGTDCVSFPSIGYGNFSNPRNARISKFCFKNCSLILPVHQSLVLYDYTYQNLDYPQQGILYFIPNLKTPIEVIHNGYDSNYWKRGEIKKIPNSLFTVLGHVNSRFTLQLKGIDLFIDMARKFPNASFTIIGGKGLILENKPNNLILISNVWGKDLIQLFSQQEFYVQLSMSEGFPNALSEAMLCECIPIVSNVGGMPDIVGQTGFVLETKDPVVLEKLINTALKNIHKDKLAEAAREQIAENYTFRMRQVKMLNALNLLLEF